MNPQPTPAPTDTPQSPAPKPTFQQAVPNSAAPTGEDPGKGLAIAGVILAFFFSLVGLILSIVAKKKSKAAGFNNSLATVGIVLNAVFLVFGLLIFALLVAITMASYSGIQERAKSSSAQSSATNLLKKTEAHYATYGTYPASIQEMNRDNPSRVSSEGYYELAFEPITESTARKTVGIQDKDILNLYTCGMAGNKIAYWNYTTDKVAYLYSGQASTSSGCRLIVN